MKVNVLVFTVRNQSATQAKIIEISDGRIKIDTNFTNYFEFENPNILLIFQLKPPLIRTYDLEKKFVYKMTVILENVIPSFIGALGHIFIQRDIYPIHTSALCFFENVCSYEAYIKPNQIDYQFDEISQRIMTIEGVKDVLFDKIQ